MGNGQFGLYFVDYPNSTSTYYPGSRSLTNGNYVLTQRNVTLVGNHQRSLSSSSSGAEKFASAHDDNIRIEFTPINIGSRGIGQEYRQLVGGTYYDDYIYQNTGFHSRRSPERDAALFAPIPASWLSLAGINNPLVHINPPACCENYVGENGTVEGEVSDDYRKVVESVCKESGKRAGLGGDGRGTGDSKHGEALESNRNRLNKPLNGNNKGKAGTGPGGTAGRSGIPDSNNENVEDDDESRELPDYHWAGRKSGIKRIYHGMINGVPVLPPVMEETHGDLEEYMRDQRQRAQEHATEQFQKNGPAHTTPGAKPGHGILAQVDGKQPHGGQENVHRVHFPNDGGPNSGPSGLGSQTKTGAPAGGGQSRKSNLNTGASPIKGSGNQQGMPGSSSQQGAVGGPKDGNLRMTSSKSRIFGGLDRQTSQGLGNASGNRKSQSPSDEKSSTQNGSSDPMSGRRSNVNAPPNNKGLGADQNGRRQNGSSLNPGINGPNSFNPNDFVAGSSTPTGQGSQPGLNTGQRRNTGQYPYTGTGSYGDQFPPEAYQPQIGGNTSQVPPGGYPPPMGGNNGNPVVSGDFTRRPTLSDPIHSPMGRSSQAPPTGTYGSENFPNSRRSTGFGGNAPNAPSIQTQTGPSLLEMSTGQGNQPRASLNAGHFPRGSTGPFPGTGDYGNPSSPGGYPPQRGSIYGNQLPSGSYQPHLGGNDSLARPGGYPPYIGSNNGNQASFSSYQPNGIAGDQIAPAISPKRPTLSDPIHSPMGRSSQAPPPTGAYGLENFPNNRRSTGFGGNAGNAPNAPSIQTQTGPSLLEMSTGQGARPRASQNAEQFPRGSTVQYPYGSSGNQIPAGGYPPNRGSVNGNQIPGSYQAQLGPNNGSQFPPGGYQPHLEGTGNHVPSGGYPPHIGGNGNQIPFGGSSSQPRTLGQAEIATQTGSIDNNNRTNALLPNFESQPPSLERYGKKTTPRDRANSLPDAFTQTSPRNSITLSPLADTSKARGFPHYASSPEHSQPTAMALSMPRNSSNMQQLSPDPNHSTSTPADSQIGSYGKDQMHNPMGRSSQAPLPTGVYGSGNLPTNGTQGPGRNSQGFPNIGNAPKMASVETQTGPSFMEMSKGISPGFANQRTSTSIGGTGAFQGPGGIPQGSGGIGQPPGSVGMGTPPGSVSMGTPQGGMGPPPVSGGMGPPPVSGGKGSPRGSGGMGTPQGGMGPPPGSVGMGTPPGSGGMGLPQGSGGMGNPPGSGGMANPPGSGGMGNPPGSGGMGNPPGSGGMGQPPGSGGMGQPPGSGGMGQPPGSGGMGNPPGSGSMGQPPGPGGFGASPGVLTGPEQTGGMPPGGTGSAPNANIGGTGPTSGPGTKGLPNTAAQTPRNSSAPPPAVQGTGVTGTPPGGPGGVANSPGIGGTGTPPGGAGGKGPSSGVGAVALNLGGGIPPGGGGAGGEQAPGSGKDTKSPNSASSPGSGKGQPETGGEDDLDGSGNPYNWRGRKEKYRRSYEPPDQQKKNDATTQSSPRNSDTPQPRRVSFSDEKPAGKNTDTTTQRSPRTSDTPPPKQQLMPPPKPKTTESATQYSPRSSADSPPMLSAIANRPPAPPATASPNKVRPPPNPKPRKPPMQSDNSSLPPSSDANSSNKNPPNELPESQSNTGSSSEKPSRRHLPDQHYDPLPNTLNRAFKPWAYIDKPQPIKRSQSMILQSRGSNTASSSTNGQAPNLTLTPPKEDNNTVLLGSMAATNSGQKRQPVERKSSKAPLQRRETR